MNYPTPLERAKHTHPAEMRRLKRFRLHAGCTFWWHSDETGTMFGDGQTVDLSSGGACVRSSYPMQPGQLLSIEVTLPAGVPERDDAHGSAHHRPLTLRGEGYVIWSDATRQLFAAQVCFASLETGQAEQDTKEDSAWLSS